MTVKTRHTPGPWKMSKCVCGHPRCKDYWVSSGKFCQGSGFSEANARLVAAAPDLLSAAYAIEGASEYMEFDSDSRFGEALSMIVAALAKALGEQQ